MIVTLRAFCYIGPISPGHTTPPVLSMTLCWCLYEYITIRPQVTQDLLLSCITPCTVCETPPYSISGECITTPYMPPAVSQMLLPGCSKHCAGCDTPSVFECITTHLSASRCFRPHYTLLAVTLHRCLCQCIITHLSVHRLYFQARPPLAGCDTTPVLVGVYHYTPPTTQALFPGHTTSCCL